MSDDWQIGDRAVCVDFRSHGLDLFGGKLIEGRTYTVARYGEADSGEVCLGFNGHVDPSDGKHWAYHPWRFRKIRPDEPEACEEEFRILLQLSKKRVSA